jgi:hypothetical protein
MTATFPDISNKLMFLSQMLIQRDAGFAIQVRAKQPLRFSTTGAAEVRRASSPAA